MNKLKKNFLLLALIGFSSPILAVTTPKIKEVRNVMEYYYNGEKSGPILMQLLPCLNIDQRKNSKTQYECNKPAPSTIKKGTTISAWTSWFVPKSGKYDNIMIQFVHDGIVRSTKDVMLVGGTRKRAYRSEKLSKSGRWEIRVLKGKRVIASSKFAVK